MIDRCHNPYDNNSYVVIDDAYVNVIFKHHCHLFLLSSLSHSPCPSLAAKFRQTAEAVVSRATCCRAAALDSASCEWRFWKHGFCTHGRYVCDMPCQPAQTHTQVHRHTGTQIDRDRERHIYIQTDINSNSCNIFKWWCELDYSLDWFICELFIYYLFIHLFIIYVYINKIPNVSSALSLTCSPDNI
jgi:hypothetical protein